MFSVWLEAVDIPRSPGRILWRVAPEQRYRREGSPVNKIGPPPIPEDEPLLKVAHAAIRREGMLRPGDAVLIGVSGGRDSTSLMVLLVALAPPLRLRLGVAHFHHGLRGAAADRDAVRVEQQALGMGLPFFYAKGDAATYRRIHRLSSEEAARDLRYAFLEATACRFGFQRIALGHHADDNAELVLMRLLRGSGPSGLAGIPPMRPLGTPSRMVIRPLISSSRAAIDRFCRQHGLATGEDATNRTLHFTRNRIRHDLLPKLRREYNPNIAAGLNRLARLTRDEEAWLESLVDDHLRRVTLEEAANHHLLDGAALARSHPGLQRRLLRAALARIRGDLRRIGFELIEAVRALLKAECRSGAVDLPGGLRAIRLGNRLYIGPPPATIAPIDYAYTVTGTGVVNIEEIGARLHLERLDRVVGSARAAGQCIAYFDMDHIDFPITIRNFRPGDRFAPFGLQGTQKLKKYFIDHKIPRAQRHAYPLVVSRGEIIWIAGLRRSDRAPVGARSTAILKMELLVA